MRQPDMWMLTDLCCHLQMGEIVAESVLTFDQSFWMRLALRHDQATSEAEKSQ